MASLYQCLSCGVLNGPIHYPHCIGANMLPLNITPVDESKNDDASKLDLGDVKVADAFKRFSETNKEVRSVSATGGEKGVKEQRFDLIPIGPFTELAEHYGRGAKKYANHQWRVGYEWSKSYAALMRHLTAFWSGEDYDTCPQDRSGCASFPDDPDDITDQDYSSTCYNHTGSHHMVAVAWHAFALLEFKDKYPDYDDRYEGLT